MVTIMHQCHECRNFNITEEYVTVCEQCAPDDYLVADWVCDKGHRVSGIQVMCLACNPSWHHENNEVRGSITYIYPCVASCGATVVSTVPNRMCQGCQDKLTSENLEDTDLVVRRLKQRHVLEQIWQVWKDKPNLRLGQLLCAGVATHEESNMFFIEDKNLVLGVQELT